MRGLLAGVAATLLAAGSHTLAGDRAPSSAGLLLALFFSAIVSIALTGRALSAVRLSASVVLSQLGFHIVFSTLGGAAEVVTLGHHGQTVISGADAVVHASSGMWLAHGTAAVITIALLLFGERALYSLRDTARMLLAAILSPTVAPVVAIDRAPLPAVVTFSSPRIVRELCAALGVRGPPLSFRSA